MKKNNITNNRKSVSGSYQSGKPKIRNYKQVTSYLFIILFAAFSFTSCHKEEIIILDPPEEKPVPNNPTDIKIQEFLEEYQSEIIYRWDRRYTSSDAKVTPADFELVLPYISLIEDFWIHPFDSQKDSFMKSNIPIEIILVGSTIRYHEGEEQGFNAAGQAISFSRILLAGVNEYSMQDTFWFEQQVYTMHHEFAHILDKKYGRPSGFDDISKGLYAGSTSFTQFTQETARERGFWIPYGMSNEAEDFATFVEAFLELPKNELLLEIEDNDLLKQKYDLVYNYYLDLGIDLHTIHNTIQDTYHNVTSE